MSLHLYTYIDPPNERHIEQIVRVLSNGGVLALPMETSWSFCCDASSRRGLDKIRLLKPSRTKAQPFSLICSDISMASTMANIGNEKYRMLRQALPGPYTFILRRGRLLPKRLKDRRENVGIRIPNDPLTLAIIKAFEKPLAASSVPLREDETAIQMGYELFDLYGHGIDIVADLGEELPGTETTIFDFTQPELELVRVGAGDPHIFGEL
jgi:tRNA threonylcarbamoyl adenosine modification protein (Sua5/YciO/YrdC/YwlC family)